MKKLLFLMLISCCFYCRAYANDFTYDSITHTFYRPGGSLYTGTIEDEQSGSIFLREIKDGKEISCIEQTQTDTFYIECTYPGINTKHGKIYSKDKKHILIEFTLVSGELNGKYIVYAPNGLIGIIYTYIDGKKEGIAELSNISGNKWGEILFKNDEPVSGFCYSSITHQKIKLSQLTMQNVLRGNKLICSE